MDMLLKRSDSSPQCAFAICNLISMIAFVWSPNAKEYSMAMFGMIAFCLVHLFLPACWFNLSSAICPGNFAQLFFWIQIVLVPILVGYFGPSAGTLPRLPSDSFLNDAMFLRAVGYISFCVAFQVFHWMYSNQSTLVQPRSYGLSAHTTIVLILSFAVVGLVGWLLNYGGVGGFIAYASSPEEQRLRDLESTSISGAVGNLLRHFLGFSVVWAWSEWVKRQSKIQRFQKIVVVSTIVATFLMLANFSYNRGNMVVPLLAMLAAFSQHVCRVSSTVVLSICSVVVVTAVFFGHYRSTSMEITELSLNDMWSFIDQQGVVDEVQIYGVGPHLSAFLLEGVSAQSATQKYSTIMSSAFYPIPILGKPFRESSGVLVFNQLIYGDIEIVDQNIPYDAEFFINLGLSGVIIGYTILGCVLAYIQMRFFKAVYPITSYAWMTVGIWIVFPASLPVLSQVCIYSFWPLYGYAALTAFLRKPCSRDKLESL